MVAYDATSGVKGTFSISYMGKTCNSNLDLNITTAQLKG
jgi:hypothetical protein